MSARGKSFVKGYVKGKYMGYIIKNIGTYNNLSMYTIFFIYGFSIICFDKHVCQFACLPPRSTGIEVFLRGHASIRQVSVTTHNGRVKTERASQPANTSAGTRNTLHRQKESEHSLWTPSTHNPSKKDLLRIISYVRTQTIQRMSIMSIRASYQLFCGHARLKRSHDESE